MTSKLFSTTLLILLAASSAIHAQVRLPRLVSNGMVLQRDVPCKIWGWASANESITITFLNRAYRAKANGAGEWFVQIPPQQAGGPHTLTIKAANEIVLQNILYGDVWVCSGQSNMELTMDRLRDKYPTEIANSKNSNIRQFLVPDAYNFKQPQTDVESGNWVEASPETIYSFSAVAYFFAHELNQKYKVPIGLINSALGGSPAEAWMSEDALQKFPSLYEEMQKFKNDKYIEEIETTDRQKSNAWYAEVNAKDVGLKKWNAENMDESSWDEMQVPGYWADGPLGQRNGTVWFRKKITIPKSMVGKAGSLWLGRIVDADSVFVNGRFVGTTSYQYPPRKYSVSKDILKEGDNTIAVRLISNGGRGGFVLDKPYFIAVGSDTINLTGIWKYKMGAAMPAMAGSTTIRFKPGGLYNKMISPLLPYSIKGVIWYQGESNIGRHNEYETLFPALITNWREKWNQKELPFLFVQLASFLEAKPEPEDSYWAALREAQRKTLALPKTGMAVAIDVGEWNDVHPLNKQDVGKRLALAAQRVVYNEKRVVYSGPTYVSHEIKNNQVVIKFSNTGSGLMARRNNDIKQFAIAGADKKFVWAEAKIDGNRIVVWSDNVSKPAFVRYAWSDNPEGANLYNKEGLPASPFTTEQ